MKIQFNLLPDVKQQYIKTQRTKRTAITVAFLVAGVSFIIFFLMLSTVFVINKKQLSDAGKDIARYNKELKEIPDIDKILTIQSQLETLVELHQGKHSVSRLFTYLPQVTPTNVNLGSLSVDFATSTMEISGTTDTQKSINTYVDTLKFTTYKLNGEETKTRAFPSVIESGFGLTEKGANYTIIVQFDPVLFANSQKVELSVPAGLATTRSLLQDPNNVLFNGQGAKPKEEGQ